MVWNFNNPNVIVYNAVEELVYLAAAGNVPQKISNCHHWCGNDSEDSGF